MSWIVGARYGEAEEQSEAAHMGANWGEEAPECLSEMAFAMDLEEHRPGIAHVPLCRLPSGPMRVGRALLFVCGELPDLEG